MRREMVTRTKYLAKGYMNTVQMQQRGGLYTPELDVDTLIALKLFFHVLEQKVVRLRLPHITRRR